MSGTGAEEQRRRRAAFRLQQQQAISRRRFLTVAVHGGAVAALGGLAAACSSKDSSTPTVGGPTTTVGETVPGPQPVSGGQRGGRIVAGYSTEPASFDPIEADSFASWDASAQLAFWGGLYAYDGDSGGAVPNLAEDVHVSQDGRTLTFTMRNGVKFHNGREMEAEDVRYSLERLIHHESPLVWGFSYFSGVEGYDAAAKGSLEERIKNPVEGFEVKDSRTFVMHMKDPDATIPNILALPFSAIVPQEEVERYGKDFGRKAIGYGPYVLESFDEIAQKANFSLNPDYFYEGLPYLDEIEVRWGLTFNLMLQLLDAGELDMCAEGDNSFLEQAAANPALADYVINTPVLSFTYVELFTNNEPVNDVKVRQALNLAVDRTAFEAASFGGDVAQGYPFPEALGIPHLVEPFGYDADRARELLAEAGYADGFEVEYPVASSGSAGIYAEILQQQLKDVGVTLNLKQYETGTLYDLEAQASVPLFETGWFMSQPEASDVIDSTYVTGGSYNFDGYSNEEVDRLEKEAKAEFDRDARFGIYAEIERILMEDAKNLWLVTSTNVAANGSRIQNYHWRGETQTYYDRLWVSS